MSTNQPPPQGPGQGGQAGWPPNANQPYGSAPQPPPPGAPPGPPQGPPQGQWATAQPEQPPPGRGRRRGVTIGIVAVAVVALVAGAGVFAWSKLSGGGAQPADAIPSDAMAYARVDLDPSAEQKLNAMSLLDKWPEFEEATGISENDVDLRKLFIDQVASEDCDIDYNKDVEPWIGDRLGFAILPGEDEPAPVIAVQVDNQDDAEDGAKKLAECAGGGLGSTPETADAYGTSAATDESSKAGIAFSGDYMLVAEDQKRADDYAADAEDSSLASSDAFSEDMDALGDEGIASAWFDGDAFVDLADQMGMGGSEAEALKDMGTGAAALRAGDDYLELVSATTNDAGQQGEQSNVHELPDSTMAAVSISDGKSVVEKFWSQFESAMMQTDPGVSGMLSNFQAQTGLALPDDLATLLGDKAMLAVDSEGLDPDSPPQSMADINAGLRLTSDPDEVGTVVDKVMSLIERQGGSQLTDGIVREDTDDGVVLASNDSYAKSLTEGGGGLGDSEAFKNAVPDAEDAINVAYVDLDRMSKLGDAEEMKPMEPVQAVGLSTSSDDGRAHATMRVTFD